MSSSIGRVVFHRLRRSAYVSSHVVVHAVGVSVAIPLTCHTARSRDPSVSFRLELSVVLALVRRTVLSGRRSQVRGAWGIREFRCVKHESRPTSLVGGEGHAAGKKSDQKSKSTMLFR
jgi:hypothetical protein